MFVTVYTDASYCPRSKTVGIAYYVRSDIGLIKHACSLEYGKVQDINDAEMLAIKLAIERCLND
jgi:ribonuclease HI